MAEEPNMEPKEEAPGQAPELNEVETLKKKVFDLENSLSQLKDQLLRKAAEFENYKKRVENDYATVVKFSNEELISALLPVLDDFYRSLKMRKKINDPKVQNNESDSTSTGIQSSTNNGMEFIRGMELIYDKLLKILEGEGIRQFDSVGKTFDPHYHDALLQIPKNDVPPHTVLEEVEKGYTLHDKVIRHAKVIVSGEMPSGEEMSKANGNNDKMASK